MPINRKPAQAEPSPRMRYYLLNLPAQLRSPEDFDRLSRLMGELPRDSLNERMSHKEVRLPIVLTGGVVVLYPIGQ